jgi:hypothetical protein
VSADACGPLEVAAGERRRLSRRDSRRDGVLAQKRWMMLFNRYVFWFLVKEYFRRLFMRLECNRTFISDKIGYVDYEWRRCADCGTCFHTLIYGTCPMHDKEDLLYGHHPEQSFGGCPLPRWRVPKMKREKHNVS